MMIKIGTVTPEVQKLMRDWTEAVRVNRPPTDDYVIAVDNLCPELLTREQCESLKREIASRGGDPERLRVSDVTLANPKTPGEPVRQSLTFTYDHSIELA